MAIFQTVPTKNNGDLLTTTLWNTYIRDNLNKLGSLMHRVVTVAQFAGLTPEDQDEVYLEIDATNGIYWHLRYRAASGSAYKWEFLGGPPLSAEVATAESTASATYTALTTAGPSVAIPRAGDYDISIESTQITGVNNNASYHSYDIGGTGAVDGDAATLTNNLTTTPGVSVERTQRKTGLTAVTLTSKYRSGSGTSSFRNRRIAILPVRIS